MINDARVAASSAQGGGGAGIGTAPARGQQGSCCAQLQGDARVYLGPWCMCSTCAFVGRCSSAAAGTDGRPAQIRRWHQWRCGCLFLFFCAVMHWREGVRSTVLYESAFRSQQGMHGSCQLAGSGAVGRIQKQHAARYSRFLSTRVESCLSLIRLVAWYSTALCWCLA